MPLDGPDKTTRESHPFISLGGVGLSFIARWAGSYKARNKPVGARPAGD
jgi:hypothetical protein